MDSEKRCASSSSSSSAWAERFGGETDRLVKTEIEAAETLADLAQLAMRETGSDSGEKWWKKGKRGRRRFTRESPTGDSGLNTLDSVSKCRDLSRGQAVVGHQPHQQISVSEPKKIQQDVCLRLVKVEKDADLPKTSTACPTSYSLVGCSKSRHNLTEEEKEARRIRRVLANRESARQTIRRRQALCEELTRKAANLALENESLKREKELALKEYQSLETTNKHLKAQIAKSISTEGEKNPVERDSSVAEIGSSSSNGPWFLYNHFPVSPIFWPSVIQSSNPVQFQRTPHSSVAIPSNISVPFSSESDLCHKQNNLKHDNQTRSPLYMFPCPWFFPLPEFGHGQPPPSIGLKDKPDELPAAKQCSDSSSLNTVANVDNHVALPFKLKKEASHLTEAGLIDDAKHTTPKFLFDGGEQQTGCHIIQRCHGPSLACVGHATSVKGEHGLQLHPAPNTEISSTTSHVANSLLEKKQEQVICPGKNLVDAVAAAEARKRRKELTKLKSIHSRQCRMHC